MNKSTSIIDLAKALAAFQGEVGNVAKDATNPFFKSKYASLENIISTVKPILAKHGLAYAQFPDGDGLTTILMHETGDWIEATSAIKAKDETAQGQGSAITYARRYALASVLGLATEDDDDGQAASHLTKAKAPAAAATPSKPTPPKSVSTGALALKDRIKTLVDKQVINPLSTKEEYEQYVKGMTGLELRADNYETIIKRLEAMGASEPVIN